jgi:hypothetical protein
MIRAPVLSEEDCSEGDEVHLNRQGLPFTFTEGLSIS